jgi:hypothetical protein
MAFAIPLVLVCFFGLTFPHRFRGLVQRVAETAIFAGVAAIGFWIYRAGA